MYSRILSTGSTAAALAALLFVAGSGVAQAARCPLGEIYRPSRGICVTKEKAIQAGIYRGASQAQASRSRDVAPVVEAADSETVSAAAPVPKPRPQAMAAIEREAPVSRRKAEEALAFTRQREPAPASAVTPIQPKTVQTVPVVLSRPQSSPFGSLVALEPLP
jgi:hypothetical protein